MRIDPARALPGSRDVSPAASDAAPPPAGPPGVRGRSHGLGVRPWPALRVCQSAAKSGTLVLPSTPARAPLSRATTAASRAGTWVRSDGEPAVVVMPAVSNVSFTVTGTP